MKILTGRIRTLAFAGVLSLGLIFLSASLDSFYYQVLYRNQPAGQDLFSKVLGEARKIISQVSYIKANEYLHGGAMIFCPAGEHDHKHHAFARPWNILPYLREKTMVSAHRHIPQEEQQEMLPWFYYAVRLDPHNVHAYQIGGHWLSSGLDKDDEAIGFLRQGLGKNPFSPELYLELGQIMLWKKKDHRAAVSLLETAVKLLTQEDAAGFERREAYSMLAYAYLESGRKQEAREIYLKLRQLFPDDDSFIRILESPDLTEGGSGFSG